MIPLFRRIQPSLYCAITAKQLRAKSLLLLPNAIFFVVLVGQVFLFWWTIAARHVAYVNYAVGNFRRFCRR